MRQPAWPTSRAASHCLLRLWRELLSTHAPSVALRCGVIARQTGRHPRAVELIGRAIAQHGGSAAAHFSLGVALTALGRHQEALASYEAALALEPDYVE